MFWKFLLAQKNRHQISGWLLTGHLNIRIPFMAWNRKQLYFVTLEADKDATVKISYLICCFQNREYELPLTDSELEEFDAIMAEARSARVVWLTQYESCN